MTDRFFAEIEDARERAVTEAAWRDKWRRFNSDWMPESVAERYSENEAARQVGQVLEQQVRPFLAMYDAVRGFETKPEANEPTWPPMSTDWDEAKKHAQVLVLSDNRALHMVVWWEPVEALWRSASNNRWDQGWFLGWWPLPEVNR